GLRLLAVSTRRERTCPLETQPAEGAATKPRTPRHQHWDHELATGGLRACAPLPSCEWPRRALAPRLAAGAAKLLSPQPAGCRLIALCVRRGLPPPGPLTRAIPFPPDAGAVC